jgi:uncharacterized protein YggT (Ycf19 family)
MLDAINIILDLAGLLLWLNWRSVRLDPLTRLTPATLAGTVRRAEPMRFKRWHFVASLAGLLLVRAFFYEHLGPAANWTPRLNLVLIMPAFPLVNQGHAFFLSALLFSLLSFLRVLFIFYFWLLVIAMLNRRETNPDPLQKLLALHLGRAARWPLAVQLLLPVVVAAALWMLFHPLLKLVGVTTAVRSNGVLAAQGAVLGVAAYLSLKFLLPAILAVHVIISYVYLGTNAAWDFVNTTSRNILAPFKRMPLRFGRVDIAAIIGIVFIVLLLHVLPGYILAKLNASDRTIWPR